jgi:hypothetical protein
LSQLSSAEEVIAYGEMTQTLYTHINKKKKTGWVLSDVPVKAGVHP